MEKTDKKKILLVEDDPFISEMYAVKFDRAGFLCEVAMTGKEGFSKADSWRPDIILLDVLIPEMDGFEVLTALKKDEVLSSVPVIMLTNLGQKEDIERGMALGAAAYVVKAHFTPQEVVDKVKQILGGNG